MDLSFGTLPTGVTAGSPSTATVTLLDDDPPTVTITLDADDLNEDNEVEGPFGITLEFSKEVGGDVNGRQC